MAGKEEVVEVIHGEYSRYEIVKEPGGVFTNPKFWIRKDGKWHGSSYSSLRDAVEAAKAEG